MIEVFMSLFTIVARVISLIVSCATYVALSRRLDQVERQLDNLSNATQPGLKEDATVPPFRQDKKKPRFAELVFGVASAACPWKKSRSKRKGKGGQRHRLS
jgi:hypothetical protein